MQLLLKDNFPTHVNLWTLLNTRMCRLEMLVTMHLCMYVSLLLRHKSTWSKKSWYREAMNTVVLFDSQDCWIAVNTQSGCIYMKLFHYVEKKSIFMGWTHFRTSVFWLTCFLKQKVRWQVYLYIQQSYAFSELLARYIFYVHLYAYKVHFLIAVFSAQTAMHTLTLQSHLLFYLVKYLAVTFLGNIHRCCILNTLILSNPASKLLCMINMQPLKGVLKLKHLVDLSFLVYEGL